MGGYVRLPPCASVGAGKPSGWAPGPEHPRRWGVDGGRGGMQRGVARGGRRWRRRAEVRRESFIVGDVGDWRAWWPSGEIRRNSIDDGDRWIGIAKNVQQ